MNKRTSLVSFLLVLLFAAAADGLMEALEPIGFLAAGAVVMGGRVGTERKNRLI